MPRSSRGCLQWVDLDAIREVVDRLDRQESEEVTARDLMHMRLGAALAEGVAHFEADEALSERDA